MAINLTTLSAEGRWKAPSDDYPQGEFLNSATEGDYTGSYCRAEWANEIFGFFGAALSGAGLTPNGTPETAKHSQIYDAIVQAFDNRIDAAGCSAVIGMKANIDTVVANVSPIKTVSGSINSVKTVSNNVSNIKTCAENISLIQQAQPLAADLLEQIKTTGAAQKSAVTAEGDKQIARLQTKADEVIALGTTNQRTSWTLSAAVAQGTAITIPNGIKYNVGRNTLRINWNGLALALGENYSEVGAADAVSTSFKLAFGAKQGDFIEVWVSALGVKEA